MAKHTCQFVVIILLLVFSQSFVKSQDFKFSNETLYLGEVLTHTSPNPGKNIHFIGWLLNTSTFSYGPKHSINLGLMLTHGDEPSADIVGDLQTFSNIEAGNLLGFYEVFYQYRSEKFWIKAGQQDINTDFFVSENGLLFTHSSFGMDPVAALNIPGPSYPVTALALTYGINLNPNLKLKLGIFDGQHVVLGSPFLTINWNLNKDEGLIYIAEPEFKLLNGRLSQKVGIFHHSGLQENFETQSTSRGLTAFYLVSDFELMKKEEKSAHLFLQFDTSTKSVSNINNYYGLGLKLDNFIRTEKKNEIGLAIGRAKLNHEFSTVATNHNLITETIVEVNYKQAISDKISLQPYFHWIGMREINNPQRNPIVLALRAYIEF